MNANQHVVIGLVTGAAFSFAKYQIRKTFGNAAEINWVEFFIDSGIGMLLSTLPDILEPATNSNHRKFFHSVTFGGIVIWGAFGPHSSEWPLAAQMLAQAAAVSYISHLLADSITPKRIPWIHPGLF